MKSEDPAKQRDLPRDQHERKAQDREQQEKAQQPQNRGGRRHREADTLEHVDQQRVDEIDAEGGVRELCDRPGMPEFPPPQREEEAEGGARLQEARQREVAEEPAVRLALVAGPRLLPGRGQAQPGGIRV